MSVQNEIDRITANVENTYAVLEGYGATMPDAQNSDNLSATAASVPVTGMVFTTAGTGAAYTVTVPGLTQLKVGARFVMVPHTNSTDTNATLNVNGLGAKYIRQRLTTNTSATTTGHIANWLVANKPVEVMYNGTYWVTDIIRQDANNIYGRVPVASGGVPSATTDNNGQFLRVVDGTPTWTTVSNAEEASF